MKRVVCLILGILMMLTLVSPAQAGTYFNRPQGVAGSNSKTQYTQIDQFVAATKAMKKGGKIEVALYSLNQSKASNAMCSADARGVRVIFVTFVRKDHPLNDQTKQLARCLGPKHKTKGSLFKACNASCAGPGDTMHDKFATFSPNKIMWGSGNFTRSSAVNQFVDWTWVSDTALYNQANAQIGRMLKDKTNRACSHVRSKKADAEVWYYPCKSANPNLDALRYMRCNKKSKVYAGMFLLGPSAKSEITELLQCKKAGGDVRFLGDHNQWSKSRVKDMLDGGRVSKKYKGVHIPVYDSVMKNGTYWHGKTLTIQARNSKKKPYLVAFSGSYDWGVVSRRDNDNFTLIQRRPATVNQFIQRFLFAQKYGHRIYKP